MGGAVRFVFGLIWIAIAIGLAGNLVEASIFYQAMAHRAYLQKGMSAKWWNNQLEDSSESRPSQTRD